MGTTLTVRGLVSSVNDLSKWRYNALPERIHALELGEYYTFGIQAKAYEQSLVLHDVSVCKKTVEHMVEALNFHQASPIHFCEIVTDMLL